MVDIDIAYLGALRTHATHGPSGTPLTTDAPRDNHGKGESFSPTDLLATALGTCMITVMGIAARGMGKDLEGARVHVKKEMTKAPPRRIDRLPSSIAIPAEVAARFTPDERATLEKIAHECPVRLSLLPAIDVPLAIVWSAESRSDAIASAAATAEEVLAFWLGGDPDALAKRWFSKDETFDAMVRERFGATIEAAGRGELDAWKDSPRSALALVVVQDQFPRNAFRGSSRSFAQDAHALAVVRAGLARGFDRDLTPIERYVFAMPFMHVEDAALQREGVETFRRFAAEARAAGAPPASVAMAERATDFAEQHARIVERFGRFPHRNAIVARPTTPEEEAFLKEPGSSF